jgi:ribosomal-protein-alanine N-acetyltransferase
MIAVEPFNWWHIPAATEIELELFPQSAWSESQFWSELAADHRMLLVAQDNAELVGYAGININKYESEIMTIAVRPSHQGKGLGSALLRQMLDASDAAAVPRVLLEVEVGNDPAIGLYERFGFVRNGIRPNYYGPGIGALLMERHV